MNVMHNVPQNSMNAEHCPLDLTAHQRLHYHEDIENLRKMAKAYAACDFSDKAKRTTLARTMCGIVRRMRPMERDSFWFLDISGNDWSPHRILLSHALVDDDPMPPTSINLLGDPS